MTTRPRNPPPPARAPSRSVAMMRARRRGALSPPRRRVRGLLLLPAVVAAAVILPVLLLVVGRPSVVVVLGFAGFAPPPPPPLPPGTSAIFAHPNDARWTVLVNRKSSAFFYGGGAPFDTCGRNRRRRRSWVHQPLAGTRSSPSSFSSTPSNSTRFDRALRVNGANGDDSMGSLNGGTTSTGQLVESEVIDEGAERRRHPDRGARQSQSNASRRNLHFPCLSPYQVLHPLVFGDDYDDFRDNDDARPIDASLELLRDALRRVQQRGLPGSGSVMVNDDDDAFVSSVVRIQTRVSHSVDPLAWLSAQQPNLSRRRRRKQTPSRPDAADNDDNDNDSSASFYLNVEKDGVEVAACGSALVLRDAGDDALWHLVEALPDNCRLYGGARFDRNLTHVGNEWRRFGKGVWMLPALEMVSENRAFPGGGAKERKVTILAVHLVRTSSSVSWQEAARETLDRLEGVTSQGSSAVAPTTLPPILSRGSVYKNGDGQEVYERAAADALGRLNDPNDDLTKVVLARQLRLELGRPHWDALQLLRRWKYGGHEGGHLFYMNWHGAQFFGCTPERLFQVQGRTVSSEALAGTRPRGSTQQDDDALFRELVSSPKDRQENTITGEYIERGFRGLSERGWIDWSSGADGESLRPANDTDKFFVRRLLHLQHICQRFTAHLPDETLKVNVTRFLLEQLHPTPAVCGVPLKDATEFIRYYEASGFDRGLYSGPIGYLGREASDVLVGIRSGLVPGGDRHEPADRTSLYLYSGGGIIRGSTIQGEWSETNYKLAVISSMFPQSPLTLQNSPTANVAFATALVEELVRNGVTQFYVCPGSRSTPLVVAIARAARSHVGVLNAVSVHDERAAGFRAVGYARGSGRPAAVVTSSGTAVANLYPAIVEAGMDGIPLLLLTADRPYENRETGSNQAIDQVKMFSSTYVRWFRDMLPPDDQVPVAAALSDAAHAVHVAMSSRGPVHLNMQFRENLAPETGRIRNDGRGNAVVRFNPHHFTETPGFRRWSATGEKWKNPFRSDELSATHAAVLEVADLISRSRRGLIVVGNLRSPSDSSSESFGAPTSQIFDEISAFAQSIQFPILAGSQAAGLRFRSEAVVPFSEHILRCSEVAENLKPDLIIQIGAPLVSSALPAAIVEAAKSSAIPLNHVLVQPLHPNERFDPDYTVTHSLSCNVQQFIRGVSPALKDSDVSGSELVPLVLLGRKLRNDMKDMIIGARRVLKGNDQGLTEPEVVLALSELMSARTDDESIFLSNSMPVRDCEFFLYPLEPPSQPRGEVKVGSNRGASGIDGIIAAATGFCEATKQPTTLLIGDVSSLHDINSFHGLSNENMRRSSHPLTTVVVNNDGGGIFSFLPIAQHGADVSFNEFFGTPTRSFSFDYGAKAFGLPFQSVAEYSHLQQACKTGSESSRPSIIEARVVGRDLNVAVHREITNSINSCIHDFLASTSTTDQGRQRLSVRVYEGEAQCSEQDARMKNIVLLHGWMGDKSDWDNVTTQLVQSLSPTWKILTVDLPAHGMSPFRTSSDVHAVRTALRLDDESVDGLKVKDLAASVLSSLSLHYDVETIDVLVGYSLGGRVALAMKALNAIDSPSEETLALVERDTKLVLLGAYPGEMSSYDTNSVQIDGAPRIEADYRLSRTIVSLCDERLLRPMRSSTMRSRTGGFLLQWYGSPIWGEIVSKNAFLPMFSKRIDAIGERGRDLAAVLLQSSPPLNSRQDWQACDSNHTLYLTGSNDRKYSEIGKKLQDIAQVPFKSIPNAGHALLTEASQEVGRLILEFIARETVPDESDNVVGISPSLYSPLTDNARPPAVVPARQVDSVATSTSKKQGDAIANTMRSVGSIEFEEFSINIMDDSKLQSPLYGIGWGAMAAICEGNKQSKRTGIVLQVSSTTGLETGLGEVSPLPGLHSETLDEVLGQVVLLQQTVSMRFSPVFDASAMFAFDGSMKSFIESLARQAGIDRFHPSLYAGLEMALLSLASQVVSQPVLAALEGRSSDRPPKTVPVSGLITRGTPLWSRSSAVESRAVRFPSLKVKVGHQALSDDTAALSKAFQYFGSYDGRRGGNVRADANRAWNESQAIEFASALDGIDLHSVDRIEFIEEPLQKQLASSSMEELEAYVAALERWYLHTGIPYALDETIAELVIEADYDFSRVRECLLKLFPGQKRRGCEVLVLKPALLGLELSLRVAHLARVELGIGAIFSSSFDSGIGLAYTAMLGSCSDRFASSARTYPHGVGTFTTLASDTLNPPFASYVSSTGLLNVASLSRALFGLSLDELDSLLEDNAMQRGFNDEDDNDHSVLAETREDLYEASTATSSSGKEISVIVSMSLPFSAEIACSRFTDLPQHSRWSPWITSVSYQGADTEWSLNVRGMPLKWRATSELLTDPPGIQWESVSGLTNRGRVEFTRETEDTCSMKVQMTILTPRLMRPLFQGTSLFIEDFLRDKLLKWSLEMFRDTVKADLALERGDVELGDALYSAVEDKANVIEATLNGGNAD